MLKIKFLNNNIKNYYQFTSFFIILFKDMN